MEREGLVDFREAEGALARLEVMMIHAEAQVARVDRAI